MYVPVTSLIAQARAYVDDQHAADKHWIPDSTWEHWLTVEYHAVLHRLISDGLVGPRFVEETVTADGSDSYVLAARAKAIASVFEVDANGNMLRMLRPRQPEFGRFSTEFTDTQAGVDFPTAWAAYSVDGTGLPSDGNVAIEFWPKPTTGTYRVRLLAEPPRLVKELSDDPAVVNPVPGAPTEAVAVSLPAPAVDLICLGAANRGLIKEGAASAALYGLIKRTEEDLAFTTNGRILGMSPLVRDTDVQWGRSAATPATGRSNPATWWWL